MKENKYIHYCWFGGKKLPRLARKCIKSWKKYLPDYKIKCWNEKNCDFNECPFVAQMYKEKKWAFVADYFRTKALYEYGGIYLDTDMEIMKDISDLLEDETFLGIEDTGYIAAGVWYENKKHAKLPAELLNVYQKLDKVEIDKIGNYSIPKLISECLKKYDVKKNSSIVQTLKNGITIYPREYFYPLSYGHDNNKFTNNTRMVHYYDASWVGKKEKIELYMVRKLGRNKTIQIEKIYFKTKDIIKRIIKIPLFPIVIYRKRKHEQQNLPTNYNERIGRTIDKIKKNNGRRIVFYNAEWIGTANSTKELFDNIVDVGEIFTRKDANRICDAIIKENIDEVIFSAFAKGWEKLVRAIKQKKPNIKIKVLWHGSNSQILDSYGWKMNREIIKMYRNGKIDAIASCKKTLVEYYNRIGIKAFFLTNAVGIKVNEEKKDDSIKEKRIGIYAAKCSDWRKNMFSQIVAAGQIKDVVIDMVPLDPIACKFAEQIGVRIEGEDKTLEREEIIERMSHNIVNLYVTFSECAPMLPLESMAVGVPCLTGNNHHYFKGGELEKYLIIDNECDIEEIRRKLEKAIKNREEIIKLYQNFVQENRIELDKEMRKFLEA